MANLIHTFREYYNKEIDEMVSAQLEYIMCDYDQLAEISSVTLLSVVNPFKGYVVDIENYMDEFMKQYQDQFIFTLSLDEIKRSLYDKDYPVYKRLVIQERLAKALFGFDVYYREDILIPFIYVLAIAKAPISLDCIPDNIHQRVWCMKLAHHKNRHSPLINHIRTILKVSTRHIDTLLLHHHSIDISHKIYNAIYLVCMLLLSNNIAHKSWDSSISIITNRMFESTDISPRRATY